jgi:uncharacterized protein YndB with AHSA1/START domain
MSQHSAIHGTFTIDRHYDSAPARVFAAWANPEFKAAWFVGPAEWKQLERSHDFRVGGRELVHGRLEGVFESRFECTYHDIVPSQRIVYVYDMFVNGGFMSVSLATVTFAAGGKSGKGTHMRYTEHMTFIDGNDGSKSREEGTRALLDRLEAHLKQTR